MSTPTVSVPGIFVGSAVDRVPEPAAVDAQASAVAASSAIVAPRRRDPSVSPAVPRNRHTSITSPSLP